MSARPTDDEIRAEIAFRVRRMHRMIAERYPVERAYGDGIYLAALQWVLGMDDDTED